MEMQDNGGSFAECNWPEETIIDVEDIIGMEAPDL